VKLVISPEISWSRKSGPSLASSGSNRALTKSHASSGCSPEPATRADHRAGDGHRNLVAQSERQCLPRQHADFAK